MIHSWKSPWQRLFSLTTLVGLGVGSAEVPARAAVTPPPTNAAGDGELLFFPVGLALAPGFFPPDFGGEKVGDPGDPSLVIRVPLPRAVPPPPTEPSRNLGSDPTTDPSTRPTGGNQQPPPMHAPEPTTLLSGVIGAGLLGWFQWRRRKAHDDAAE